MASIGTSSSKLPASEAPAAAASSTSSTQPAKSKKSRNKQANKSAKLMGKATASTDAVAVETKTLPACDAVEDLQQRLHANSVAKSAPAAPSAGAEGPDAAAAAAAQQNGHSDSGISTAATSIISESTASASADSMSIGSSVAMESACESVTIAAAPTADSIRYVIYENELQMPDIMRLIQKDLSEPYSIYTYRYFIHNWPKLCYLAMHEERCVGAIVCKLDVHRQSIKRGYIAMLAVDKDYRKLKIGTQLVQNAIQAMLTYAADEVVLETEITNTPALRLYENLGFVRDKRLFGYYLNGVDALRLKLWFR